jgi:hypothetical protein
MFRFAVVAVAVSMLTGCATGAKAYMDSALSNRAEPASVWNRPQEVGFDFGPEISGEAAHQCVLGFICWGSEDGGGIMDSISGILGALTGHGGAQVGDPLVRAAAAIAVRDAQKADGIFVVSHETDSFNIYIYSKRSARVKGKSFTLRSMGEVSEARSDKVRFLSAINGSTVNVDSMLK